MMLKDQHKRFVETARKMECDEDEAAFKERLATVVGQKPGEEPKPRKTAKNK